MSYPCDLCPLVEPLPPIISSCETPGTQDMFTLRSIRIDRIIEG